MRRAVVALALASIVVAVPGYARDGGAYFELEGGALLGQGPNLEVDGTDDAMHLTANSGWAVGALLGYDLGNFRLEAEAGYKHSSLQQLVANGAFDVDAASPGVQSRASVSGDIRVKSLMVNALYDMGRDDGISVYAGAGLGYGWTKFNTKIFGVVEPFVDDSANGFAWQLMAGLRVPVTRHVELGVKYRYFNVESLDMASPISGSVKTDFRSHSILTGLTFNFGR